MAGNITTNGGFAADNSIERADLDTIVGNATVYDLEQTNMKSDFRVAKSSASSPGSTAGYLWHDTNTLAATGGPVNRFKFYNSTASLWVDLAEIIYSATAPAITENGVLWYDMTLQLLRVYHDATYDAVIHGGISGTAGWHPVSPAYQLWKNESGGDLAANLAVIRKVAGTDNVRAFTTTTTEKDQLVEGVTLEAITNNAYGVIATVAGGALVKLSVLGSTHGAIVRGDAIVTSTTAGKARNAGPLPGSATPAATTIQMGTQVGAFAEALADTSSDTTIAVRLLGKVGTGLLVMRAQTLAYTKASPSTVYTAIYPTRSTSGDGTQTGTDDLLVDAGHSPITAAIMTINLAQTSSTVDEGGLIDVSKDGTSSNGTYAFIGSGGILQALFPTAKDTATTTPGNKAFYKYTEIGTVTEAGVFFYLTGYWC